MKRTMRKSTMNMKKRTYKKYPISMKKGGNKEELDLFLKDNSYILFKYFQHNNKELDKIIPLLKQLKRNKKKEKKEQIEHKIKEIMILDASTTLSASLQNSSVLRTSEISSSDASTTLSASSPNATVLRTSASGFNAKKTIEELIKEMTPSNAESKKKGEDFVMILQQRLEEEDENSDAKRERVVKVLETKILYP